MTIFATYESSSHESDSIKLTCRRFTGRRGGSRLVVVVP